MCDIGIAAGMDIGTANPIFVCIAGLSGSCCFSHLNDSGFRITTKIAGLTVKGGLKVHTVALALLGIISLIFVSIWNMII